MKHASGLRRLLTLFAAFSLVAEAAPPDATAAESGPMWLYTVRRGDTLITIAARYLERVDRWPVVRKLNQIDDPTRLIPGTILRIPAVMLRRAPAEVTVESSSGSVRWRAVDHEWKPVSRGQCLEPGSTIETLEGGSALLRLADGSTLTLSPHSQVVFDVLSAYAGGLMVDTRLRLQNGQADVHANPARSSNRRLQIFTPSAQAVVRGTQFRIGVDHNYTRQETLSGKVLIKAGGKQVLVPMGRGTIARSGEPPLSPVVLLGKPDVSALPDRFEYLPLRFPMPMMPGAVSWHADIAEERTFSSIVLSKKSSGPMLSFADLPNGDYLLRLRAIDAQGLQGRDAVHAFTVFVRPFPPGLDAPGNEATIRLPRPDFRWSPIEGMTAYGLQLAANPGFDPLLHDTISEVASWQVPEDLPAGQFYWRVKSLDADHAAGPWGVVRRFEYKPGPGAPDPGQLGIDIESENLRINLPQPPSGLYYEAILSSTNDVKAVVAQTDSTTGKLTLPRPNGGTYYLGLRYIDSGDQTRGPLIISKIDVPFSRWWLLLLLLPLAV